MFSAWISNSANNFVVPIGYQYADVDKIVSCKCIKTEEKKLMFIIRVYTEKGS